MKKTVYLISVFAFLLFIYPAECKSFSLSPANMVYENPYVETGVAAAYVIGKSPKGIAAVVIKFNMDRKFKGYGYFIIDTVTKKILVDRSDIYSSTIQSEWELANALNPILAKYGIESN